MTRKSIKKNYRRRGGEGIPEQNMRLLVKIANSFVNHYILMQELL